MTGSTQDNPGVVAPPPLMYAGSSLDLRSTLAYRCLYKLSVSSQGLLDGSLPVL